MAISDNPTLYIDKVGRTNKIQYINAFINASYFASEKDKIVNSLGLFLDMFTSKGEPNYNERDEKGRKKRFSSIYTMGMDFCIWTGSDLKLSESAMDVAKGKVTMEYYISNILLNYHQIIGSHKELIDNSVKPKEVKKGGQVIHVLYSILSYMNINNLSSINKDTLREIDEFKLRNRNELKDLDNLTSSLENNLNNLTISINEEYEDNGYNLEEISKKIKRSNIKKDKEFSSVIETLDIINKDIPHLTQDIQLLKKELGYLNKSYKEVDQENGNINGWIDLLKSSIFFNEEGNDLAINNDIGSIENIISQCNIELIKTDSNHVRENYNDSKQKEYVDLFTKKNMWLNEIYNYNNESKSELEIKLQNTYTEYKGINKIISGAPGTGKSKLIDKEYYRKTSTTSKRITFHPEYTYNDFVGYIRPITRKIENECEQNTIELDTTYIEHIAETNNEYGINKNSYITYDFVPGPFTEILSEAMLNNKKVYNLIIEEINRANAAAVFGDLFQLLDRDSETCISEYSIHNRDIYEYIKKKFEMEGKALNLVDGQVYIPNNLNIIATMNTADQNVFIMDTAFKRRWEFEYMDIDFEKCDFRNIEIQSIGIEWERFVRTINKFMMSVECSDLMIPEDKQIGPFFINHKELNDSKKFAYKVLMYLWDDVFKMERERIFNSEIRTFSQVVNVFSSENAVDVFNEEIKNILKDNDYVKEYMQVNSYEEVVETETPEEGDTYEAK